MMPIRTDMGSLGSPMKSKKSKSKPNRGNTSMLLKAYKAAPGKKSKKKNIPNFNKNRIY